MPVQSNDVLGAVQRSEVRKRPSVVAALVEQANELDLTSALVGRISSNVIVGLTSRVINANEGRACVMLQSAV